jgi:hypothetical protein
LAKANRSLFSTIQDSLEVSRWLKQNGWEKYIAKFLEEELFIFILPDLMDESALSSVVEEKEVRERILDKAKTIKFLNRQETV